MSVLYDLIKTKDKGLTVSDKSWKLKFEGKLMQEQNEEEEEVKQEPDEETKQEPVEQDIAPVVLASAFIAVELHELEENSKYLISFNRKAGSNMAHQKIY